MMKRTEMDPLEELRRADPVDADGLPLAALARIRERTQEAVMSRRDETKTTRRRLLRWPQALGAGVAAVAVALLVLVVLTNGDPVAPGVLPDPPDGGMSARCVENYDLRTLRNRDFAFDGTVTGITGDSVTFRVNEGFRGASSDTVTLTAMGMTGTTISSVGGPSLLEGNRYLIAGDDHFVWPCGFSQPYQPDVAGQWAAALAS